MGEDPEAVVLGEVIVLHDFLAVAFGTFKEEELVDTHLTDDLGEEGEGHFAQGVETYKATDTGIHLLNGDGGVATTESVYPAAFFDRICHYFSGLSHVVELAFLDSVHQRVGVLKPFFC